MAPRYDAIVASVFVRDGVGQRPHGSRARPLQRCCRTSRDQTAQPSKPFVTTFFGNPYVATFLPELPAMLLTYDFYDRAEASAVRAIAGEAPIGGTAADRAARHVRGRRGPHAARSGADPRQADDIIRVLPSRP